jgi:23S rRNA (uracil1939-C5)-methyltransferase
MLHTNAKDDVMLDIVALTHGPYGIGRHQGRVVMVTGTVPGDRVTVRITEVRKNYAVGELIDVITPAPDRREPPCRYARSCGGCQWQQVDYRTQLAAKRQSVEDTLQRIGKIKNLDVLPIVAAPHEFGYRRRIRLHVTRDRQIGFTRLFSHDVVPIERCEVASERMNRALESLRHWYRKSTANLSEIEFVAGDEDAELVLVANAEKPMAASASTSLNELLAGGAGLSGIIILAKSGRRLVLGKSRISIITEPGVRLGVEADVFIQINFEINRALVHQLLRAGEFAAGDRILELYCGAGNFTLSLARRAAQVVAVESNARALECGKRSARENGIDNVQWELESAPLAAARLAHRREQFDKIVLDPPRGGAKGIDVHLAALQAATVAYISCEPATLARDLAGLAQRGYSRITVQPLDLFPQTFHVEVLALAQRD